MSKELYKKKGYWDFEVMSDEEFDAYRTEELEKIEDDKKKERFLNYIEELKRAVRNNKLTKVLQINRRDRNGYKVIVRFIIGEEYHNTELFERWKELGLSPTGNSMFVAKDTGVFSERLGQILENFKREEIIGREDKKEIIEEEYKSAYLDICAASSHDVLETRSEEELNLLMKEWRLGYKEYYPVYEVDGGSSSANSGSYHYSAKLYYVIMK